jgi:hypothetical protein
VFAAPGALLAGCGLWVLVASLLATWFVSGAVMFHGVGWQLGLRFD